MKKFNMDRYAVGGVPMPRGASPGMPARPGPKPLPTKPMPDGMSKPIMPGMPARPGPQPSPGMPVRPDPKPPTKPRPGPKPVISDVYPTLPKPMPKPTPKIMGGSADKMGPRPADKMGPRSASAMMAKGGMSSKMGSVKTSPGNINGVASKGKTKGTMVKMMRGGKTC